MYYNECPKCGAALDPGEPCEDCMEKENRIKETQKAISQGENGQMEFDMERKEV